jgi:protein-L-isoaspartate(D-aspartate) O-methyltransferase
MRNGLIMGTPFSLERARAALWRELHAQGISNRNVLEAMAAVAREAFVPEDLHDVAYDNRALPIGCGQTISQPYIVALMTEALEIDRNHRVLEIGTGSGYQCAILAQLADVVYTVERIAELSQRARQLLARLEVNNVHFRVGDGSLGWPEEAPFDRIMVTAATLMVPHPLAEQLVETGVLVIPLGGESVQSLYAYRKQGGVLTPTYLCDCRFVPLVEGDIRQASIDAGNDAID